MRWRAYAMSEAVYAARFSCYVMYLRDPAELAGVNMGAEATGDMEHAGTHEHSDMDQDVTRDTTPLCDMGAEATGTLGHVGAHEQLCDTDDERRDMQVPPAPAGEIRPGAAPPCTRCLASTAWALSPPIPACM